QSDRAVALVAAAEIDAKIDHNPVQPCVEARLTLETVQAFVRFEKCLLRQLKSVVAVVDHPHRDRENLALVPFDEFAERLLIPVAAFANEFSIATLHAEFLAP